MGKLAASADALSKGTRLFRKVSPAKFASDMSIALTESRIATTQAASGLSCSSDRGRPRDWGAFGSSLSMPSINP